MQAPFVWAGKSSLRRDVFAELEPSLHHGRSGARRTSRDDYADRLTSRGLLQGPAELPSRPALVAEVQAHWHSTAASGCLFEAYLSSKREHYGWVTVVPVDDEGPAAMAEQIGAEVQRQVQAEGVEIVSVVLPSVASSSQLIELLRALEAQPGWYVVIAGRDQDASGAEGPTLLGVRCRVGGQTTEVVGFGPLPLAAPTRFAPFVELVLRAKPGSGDRSSRRALLRDTDVRELPDALLDGWRERSRELRDMVVSQSERRRADSSVTFPVPTGAWPSAAEA